MDPGDDDFGVGEPAPVLVRGAGLGRRPWDFGGPGGVPFPEPHKGTFTSALPRRRGKPRRAAAPEGDPGPGS